MNIIDLLIDFQQHSWNNSNDFYVKNKNNPKWHVLMIENFLLDNNINKNEYVLIQSPSDNEIIDAANEYEKMASCGVFEGGYVNDDFISGVKWLQKKIGLSKKNLTFEEEMEINRLHQEEEYLERPNNLYDYDDCLRINKSGNCDEFPKC